MTNKDTATRLLDKAGKTFALDAGITLADKPAPLYRLLVLSTLLSTRVRAEIAVDAARELSRAGMRTPKAMAEASWQARVDALGRAHYRRYDEQTATALGKGAEQLLERYGGDLRRLRDESSSREQLRRALAEFPRLGPVGADIFLREVQQVWPEYRPALDKKVLQGAEKLGLPQNANRLARLVDDDELARLAAALVRVALRPSLAAGVAS
ncbi:endonuclease [Nocardia callitridis]|uniref:Endonuclease n=1 Tax=Nocardia callitridis TaxID=648753 RepID=A0ABP9KN57_9NOCA